jgi:peptide/nickel transport system permease protein
MGHFLLRRLLRTIVVLWGVTTIVFFVARLSGDPIALILPPDAPPAEVQRVRDRYGLNDPLPVQYAVFLGKAARGDLGESIRQHQPALRLALGRLPATVALALTSFVFAVIIGVPLGVVAGVRPRTVADNLAMTVAVIGQALPTFYLGILLILLFAVRFHLLPVGGRGGIAHLVMPTATLGANAMASIARLTRSAMLETMGQEYIRTARAKGIAPRTVTFGHGLRNALIPVVTVMGLQFGALLGGAVVTETIFSWPGMGRLAVDAIRNRDYPVVQAAVFLAAVAFVLVNLATDLLYGRLDPRIRQPFGAA